MRILGGQSLNQIIQEHNQKKLQGAPSDYKQNCKRN